MPNIYSTICAILNLWHVKMNHAKAPFIRASNLNHSSGNRPSNHDMELVLKFILAQESHITSYIVGAHFNLNIINPGI